MPLTVLSDSDIRSLLLCLTLNDVQRFQTNLAEALHDYSTGTQETTACCSANQPQRISIPAPNSQNTLFMPASTSTSRGIKIISVSSAPHSSPSASTTTLTPSSTASSHSSQPSLTKPQPPQASIASSQTTTPHGSLTLLHPSGTPYAFLSASELTAFRTALASTLIFKRRSNVHSITVFGAGKQAYWHIRLALLLRGSEIHHIDIVNRSFARAQTLMQEIYTSEEWADLRNANEKLKFSIVSADYGEYNRLLKEHVRKADIIFLCTPSTVPLFPPEHLTHSEGRRKGRYISAIGSYREHMLELHPDILLQAVAPEHKNHHHKHASKGGVIVVDGLEACLKEAGEIMQAGLGAEQLVEVGELLMVKKASMRELEMGTGEGEVGLKRWLEGGNVIYKSVGLGLMDICVGEDLVNLAREKGVGTTIPDF